ncbi:2-hydroxychromene-2-carboxylate isomerase [Pseudorhodoferax soli]|uniref:2-hydroxychromene-2-carboxylate isomerase n=1 Tax=Pseudorhodoferax soli TaxID=545864 RepID=A0A368XF85_9BURK|nr:DsbA family protein [Pseudorhodoferax soli]RCW66641.1 2-hydroxychromene-2-carboxylate isomerase [Pseudorhodoferax soli]
MLDFYFDFFSPYGYFGSTRIEALAARHGRQVRWHAFHMRSVMKDVLGLVQPLTALPLKGDYIRKDIRRVARWLDVPYAPGDAAAFANVAADRAFWLIHDVDAEAAKRFAVEVFRRHHALGDSPRDEQALMAIAVATRSDVVDLPTLLQGQACKDRLRQATEAAMAAGVWGAPTFVADGEVFWGVDRMPMLEHWLERGGW